MAIPKCSDLYGPILTLLSRHPSLPLREISEKLGHELNLTPEELEDRLPSGERRFKSRVDTAVETLKDAGLVEVHGRGVYRLTEEGRRYAGTGIDPVTIRELTRRRRESPLAGGGSTETPEIGTDLSPEEMIEDAAKRIRTALEQELLERVRQLSPRAFEELVKRLLLAMGYGARGEGVRTGRTGDQGVDVEIAEDALGLERIYVQAKRYGPGSSVSSGELRDFVGSLDMRGMNKGVFITSGTFAPGAREVAQRTSRRVVLIDGEELVRLMRAYGVGVRPRQTIVLHRLDEDFFSQLEEEA